MIGIIAIETKIGIQWDWSQIRVREGPKLFFLTLAELYSDMNNTTMAKCPNS
jgi:hypothetical protein